MDHYQHEDGRLNTPAQNQCGWRRLSQQRHLDLLVQLLIRSELFMDPRMYTRDNKEKELM